VRQIPIPTDRRAAARTKANARAATRPSADLAADVRARVLRPVVLTLLAGAFAPSLARAFVRAVDRARPLGGDLAPELDVLLRWVGACAEHPVRLGLAAGLVVLAIDFPGGPVPDEASVRGSPG
jgi:hypothetical protein